MAVYYSSTHIANTETIRWQATAVGDRVTNAGGLTHAHPTVLAVGRVRMEINGRAPKEFEAPAILEIPTGVSYRFVVLVPGFLFCVWNLLEAGAAEEVAPLITDGVVMEWLGG